MIYLPKLEYFVPCLNYCLIKSLSLLEFQEHSHQLFYDWNLLAIEQLQKQPLFNQHLIDIQNKQQCGINIRYGKSGDRFDIWNIEKRNQRFSTKRLQKKKEQAMKMHSYVPG